MESLAGNSTFAIVCTALITAVASIVVAKISNSRAQRVRIKHVKDFGGYTEYVAYLKGQIVDMRVDFNKQAKELDSHIHELEAELQIERNRGGAYLAKLLEFSRKYNEDISAVIK